MQNSAVGSYAILNEIKRDQYLVTYQGIRSEDDRLVLMRTFCTPDPKPEIVSLLKNSYDILKDLQIESVLKTFSLEVHQNVLYLIQEDFPGVYLDKLIRFENLSLLTMLQIAIELVHAIGEIHAQGIIHKDIQPQNILVNLDQMKIKITSFGLATRLKKEKLNQRNPALQDTSIPYISPEQTGRMGREMDYRTDFYSLGVTLYELFTGQLPFKGKDPQEIMNAIITNAPKPLNELKAEITIPLSMIVLKLISKIPEDRYQTAAGIKHDLKLCKNSIERSLVGEHITIGLSDHSDQFLMSKRVVGREREIFSLMHILELVCEGEHHLILFSGPSGIGKSTIINELQKPILQKRGFFITGKCGQFMSNMPYYPFIEAFKDLIQQILTESDSKLNMWKERIYRSLGKNAGVIIDFLPELKRILGNTEAAIQLETAAVQNRFDVLIEKFIGTFSTLETPLVIFINDMQWIDQASLRLLEILMSNLKTKGLLLIGSYLDHGVIPKHPFNPMMKAVSESGGKIDRFDIGSLAEDSINILLADTLHYPKEICTELAVEIGLKTDGNPFLIQDFLEYLYDKKILTFDKPSELWQWDINLIRGIECTGPHSPILSSKIKKCPDDTKTLLKIAACMGGNFEVPMLCSISGMSIVQVINALEKGLQQGLITFNESSNEYLWRTQNGQENFKKYSSCVFNPINFVHDLVLQSFFKLVNEDEKKELHKKAALLLLKWEQEGADETQLFDLANNLNLAQDKLSTPEVKLWAAKMNSISAKKALRSAAFADALYYLHAGLKLLPPNHWEDNYQLSYDLHLKLVEATLIAGNNEEATNNFKTLLEKTNSIEKKIEAYVLMIRLNIRAIRYAEAVELGREALKLLGDKLPSKNLKLHSLLEFFKVRLKLLNKNYKDLPQLPLMTDPKQLQIMKILMSMSPGVYLSDKELFAYIAMKALNLNLSYGNSESSPFLFSIYGIFLVMFFRDYKDAFTLGDTAFQLSQKEGMQGFNTAIKFVYGTFILPYSGHYKESIEILKQGYEEGAAAGDWIFSIFSLGEMVLIKFISGQLLEDLDKEVKKYGEYIHKIKSYNRGFFFVGINQIIAALKGLTIHPWSMDTAQFSEDKFFDEIQEGGYLITLYNCLTMKMQLCYLFEQYDLAEEIGYRCEAIKDSALGQPIEYECLFFTGLVIAAKYSKATIFKRFAYRKRLNQIENIFKKLSESSPENYLHKYLLLKAEKGSLLGYNYTAAESYEQAIEDAHKQAFIQNEALANELFARYYVKNGKQRLAKQYILEAIYTYYRWGAFAKINHLEKTYPEIVSDPFTQLKQISFLPHSMNQEASHTLDLATVFKATQAISKEIVLEKLLNQLMGIVIENAGAQKAILIVEKEGKWVMQAEQTMDFEEATVLKAIPIEEMKSDLPLAIIQYVLRTNENVVLDSPYKEGMFTNDPYIASSQPQSVLCFPLIHKGKLTGVLYLENNITSKAFTPNRVELLKLLTNQIATSIEYAVLYSNTTKISRDLKVTNEKLADYNQNLERRVNARSHELKDKNKQLEDTLLQIKEMQKRLIEQEKLVSLGIVSKSIATEIRNPINYIYNFSTLGKEIVDELKEAKASNSDSTTILEIEDNLVHICENSQKADDTIIKMLKNSSTGTRVLELTDINKLIRDYADLVFYNFYKDNPLFNVELETHYDTHISKINVYATDLGRVFYHIINNACDSVEQKRLESEKGYQPKITIKTQDMGEEVLIIIKDNGSGIPDEILNKLFTPFLTTKSTTKNAGMGLSISHDIIVQQHGGKIDINSKLGEYTEVSILIPKNF